MTKDISTKEKATRPKRLEGVVVSDKMTDTVVVLVDRYVKHSKYKKYHTISKRFKAHNPGNTVAVGTKVVIEECVPISKDKHFKVVSE